MQRRPSLALTLLIIALAFAATPVFAKGLPVKTATLRRSADIYVVRVVYPRTGRAAIDRAISAYARATADDFVKTTEHDHQDGEEPYELDVTFTIERNDQVMFAVLFTEALDNGGNHLHEDFSAFAFAMPDGWRVYLPELFEPAALAEISTYAIADVYRQMSSDGSEVDRAWIEAAAGADWGNFRSAFLLADTLHIYFPPWQFGTETEGGPQQTFIPMAKLTPYLRKNWRAPAASFDCAAAASPTEKAICSDVTLARLDRAVAERYALDLRSEAQDAPREALRADQDAWLAGRSAACPATRSVGCLTKLYQGRLAKLSRYPG